MLQLWHPGCPLLIRFENARYRSCVENKRTFLDRTICAQCAMTYDRSVRYDELNNSAVYAICSSNPCKSMQGLYASRLA
jgi:hypothetical protein